MTLPTHARQGNESGEEKGETSQNEDAHNDGGKIGQSLFFLVGDSVAVRGSSIAGLGGSIRGCGSAIRGSGLLVGLCGGTVSGVGSSMVMTMSSVPLKENVFGDFEGSGTGHAQSSNGGFSEHFQCE